MTAKLQIKRGGAGAVYTDVTNMTGRKGSPFFDRDTPLIQMGMRYADGESSQGQCLLVDPEAEIHSSTYRLPPHALVLWTEDASGDELWLARNRVAPLMSGRRGLRIAANDIEWEVQTVDCNIDLTGNPFPAEWDRPAETDIERLIALQALCLNGSSSTMTLKRRSTEITVDTDDNGHLLNNTTTRALKARTYPPGTVARDVITDIAERAGKEYGVVIHDVAGVSHLCLLYVGSLDHTTYQSDVRISQNVANWDPDDPTAPVVPPIWDRGKGTRTDNDAVIDYLVSLWGGTDEDPHVVVAQQDDEEPYERWGDTFFDDKAEDEEEAQNRANNLLVARRAPGHRTHQLSIKLHADQIHLVRSGMSIEIKSAVVTPAPIEYVWRRITECKYEPSPDGDYWAHLDLDKPLRRGRGAGRAGSVQPGATSPKPPPVCDDTTVVQEDCSLDADVADNSCWPGSYQASALGNMFDFFIPYKAVGSGTSCNLLECGTDLNPGDSFSVTMTVVRHSAYGSYDLSFGTNGTADGTASGTVIAHRGRHEGPAYGEEFTLTGQVHIPSDATTASITLGATYGGWLYKTAEIVRVPGTTGGDSDCVPSDTAGDSDYFARADHTHTCEDIDCPNLGGDVALCEIDSAEPPTDIVAGLTGSVIKVSSTSGTHTKERPLDGNDATAWSAADASAVDENWWAVDLSSSQRMEGFRLREGYSVAGPDEPEGATEIRIYGSNDSGAWSWLPGSGVLVADPAANDWTLLKTIDNGAVDTGSDTTGALTTDQYRYVLLHAAAGPAAGTGEGWNIWAFELWQEDLPTGGTEDIGTVGSVGTGDSAARCDHVHAHGTFASGDLHTEYVREASTEWVDLTGGGSTTLHSHTGGGGHAITEDGGSAFTSRSKLDFRNGLDVTDDSGSDSTRVAIDPSEIKLDDLGTPDDNTDLNATTSAHGLLKKLPGGTTTFLRGDGTFATPSGSGGSATTGIDWIDANDHPDRPPASPNAIDDEFAAGSLDAKWTQTGGSYAFAGNTMQVFAPSAGSALFQQAFAPGASTAFAIRMKISGPAFAGNTDLVGIGLLDGSDANICSADIRNTTTPQLHKDVAAVGTDRNLVGRSNYYYLEIARDASDVWTYKASLDGLLWSTFDMPTNTSATTVAKLSVRVATSRATTQFGTSIDWVRRIL